MRHTKDTLGDMGVSPLYVEIYLDGVKLDLNRERVISFDEQLGQIERYVMLPNSRAMTETEDFVTETLNGRVEAYAVHHIQITPGHRQVEWPHSCPEPDGPRVRIRSIRR